MTAVRLVVSCAKAKRRPAPAALCLRSVPPGPVAERAAAWLDRLTTVADTLPAAELYAGPHWRAAREAAALAGVAWVASAGYGLVPFDAPLAPYSATFTPGDPDSVVPPGRHARAADPADWWDALAARPGPSPGRPRRLADLADPGGFLLVAASAAYLRATGRDLRAAHAAAPGRVAVACGGAGPGHPLADLLLPVDAGLQPVVGGPLVALNARVARRLLAAPPAEWTVAAARERVAGWRAAAPAVTRPARRGVDDEAVVGYIRRELGRAPAASAAALLRGLRAGGLACEQRRFGRLFRLALEADVRPPRDPAPRRTAG